MDGREGQPGMDPLGESLRRQIMEFSSDVGPIQTRRIFLIDTDADRAAIERVAGELLADAIVEQAVVADGNETKSEGSRIEVHLKPGVMDPVAASTEMAVRDMGLPVREGAHRPRVSIPVPGFHRSTFKNRVARARQWRDRVDSLRSFSARPV